MKKILFAFIFILVIISAGFLLFFGGKKSPTKKMSEKSKVVRQPAVAGKFYPANSKELEKQIDEFLSKAKLPETKGEIIALILPHAGYVFSGQVAAYGFKRLIGEDIDTVLLIGNSHYEYFDGISVFKEGYFKTPLGEVKVDSELAEKIIKEDKRIFYRESAHKVEHGLEVQIPFLQKVIKYFKILPILFGNSSPDDYKILAQAVLKNIKGKNVLVIGSSDLSHYPSYEDAKYADTKTIEGILTGKVEELEKTIKSLEKEGIPDASTFACGIDAVKATMLIAGGLGANEIKLLKYANSGDVSGDKTHVVGYSAIGFFAERRGNLLNKAEKQKLLEIARTTVESFIKKGEIPKFKIDEPMLNQKLGAFVTLRKHGELRGCIGCFSPTDIPLYQVVSEMAIAAATKDPRFPEVTKEELNKIDYEISVLSNLEKINDWHDIQLGKHGVQIRKGYRSGVFLPQVATETGWSLEQFLSELCSQKAGLPKDCFKQKGVEIYIFTAQVFEEKK